MEKRPSRERNTLTFPTVSAMLRFSESRAHFDITNCTHFFHPDAIFTVLFHFLSLFLSKLFFISTWPIVFVLVSYSWWVYIWESGSAYYYVTCVHNSSSIICSNHCQCCYLHAISTRKIHMCSYFFLSILLEYNIHSKVGMHV